MKYIKTFESFTGTGSEQVNEMLSPGGMKNIKDIYQAFVTAEKVAKKLLKDNGFKFSRNMSDSMKTMSVVFLGHGDTGESTAPSEGVKDLNAALKKLGPISAGTQRVLMDVDYETGIAKISAWLD